MEVGGYGLASALVEALATEGAPELGPTNYPAAALVGFVGLSERVSGPQCIWSCHS